ncbi:MAG: benzoyl-CoA 2,3-epoxidase subunit BoxB [Myxococcales bacterium]|nr:benzoyl-CoA 2,3-epoxidase subunit BoxB [Myxococcales bacterium]USN50967.1 MAG: benzoyl-CoA 2,3-epoxidase subunit BoxB [Myxococcales bacterium]
MYAISNDRIPNNVSLADDARLRRALERWQPDFISWWKEMGPDGFLNTLVYLRTAIGVDAHGWAYYDYVRMPDYRWGIFLTPPESDRRVPFGDDEGKKTWQEIPGEYRTHLRRLIVTQADTEPASVEQQRRLGQSCPSLYDLRNLFQVNVEEGRHLWAMVYLLHSYFGRDGRDEADQLLERRSGNDDNPRILNTFNEPIDDWLSFFMFTTFTDRDGKFQLLALAESAFDPLARTCRFMLTEEAHHLFVGQSGIQRVIRRSCQMMNQHDTHDIAPLGAIPLPLIQKYINFWYSSSLDLFGSEISSNAASYFASGLKGRAYEEKLHTEHRALTQNYSLEIVKEHQLCSKEIPLRAAMNEVLRDSYAQDCQKVIEKWNKEIKNNNIDFILTLPHKRFHRNVGEYSAARFDLEGNLISEELWKKNISQWLPSEQEKTFVKSLMQRVVEPGKTARWIASPAKGINGQPVDLSYIKWF